jgi:hypothetical protein
MQGFEYPTKHERRHGPDGYDSYESYRDWLRDEFMFRCVYCLLRERWVGREAIFNIDHFVPVVQDPGGRLVFSNLVYACARCNNLKRGLLGVPDPCGVAFNECVSVQNDGGVIAHNDIGKALIKKLRLDSDHNVKLRFRWMRMFRTLQLYDPDLFREWMAFPDDLPDLRTRNSPSNSRPESVLDCFFVRRESERLPEMY